MSHSNSHRTHCVPSPLISPEGNARPRGCTPRVERLVEEALREEYGPFNEEQRLYAGAGPPEDLPPGILREAWVLGYVWTHLTPLVRDGELIVGAKRRSPTRPPEWCWFPGGNPDQVAASAKNAPPHLPEVVAAAKRGLLSPQGSVNHKIPDYGRFIHVGSAALVDRARSEAERATGEERDFLLAFALGHEGLIAHAQHYADHCEELAQEASEPRAAELRDTAQVCRRVPAYPATTFREGLQSFWFAYMLAGDGLGRMDSYLRGLYEADLREGRLTREEALELVECLLVKVHRDCMGGLINVSAVQTMTLGGLTPDGQDATSDLTHLILEAVREVRLLRPNVYLRCHSATPAETLRLATTMLTEGLGQPAFYGDEPIVRGLGRMGVPVEQARDYGLSGCTEVVLCGTSNSGAPNGWVNFALLTHEAIVAAAEAGVSGFSELLAVLDHHIERLADYCIACTDWVDEKRQDSHTNATLMMLCCLDRRRDFIHGGALRYERQWAGMGLPNAADMLYAVRRVCFDGPRTQDEGFRKRAQSLGELVEGVQKEDPVLLTQLRSLAKFGNGNPEVDSFGATLVRKLSEALGSRRTALGRPVSLGHLAGGENMHICYGREMPATADGRRAGEPLADSLGAAQGRDLSGPTALIRSICTLDHSHLVAGNVSTVRVPYTALRSDEAKEKLTDLICTFIRLGGSQLQLSVADKQTLIAAQQDPEHHAGLIVRVAGYSADFTCLQKDLQDEIISRCEHAV